jgi:co-chaperonin GroES (HSP10)
MALVMEHALDPKTELLKQLGDISKLEIFGNEVLVAIYIRPEKTAGGIFITQNAQDEDKWQGKMGLVVKKGPTPLVDEKNEVEIGDWVIFRPSDGWGLTVNNIMCRLLDDRVVRGRNPTPDTIY